jgi:uncharacterized protein (DUF4415 family)
MRRGLILTGAGRQTRINADLRKARKLEAG